VSVVLLLQDFAGAPSRLLPISTQERFVRVWLPAIAEMGLVWIGLAETGFFVTTDNRDEVLAELRRLGDWFLARDDVHTAARLDPVLAELASFRFENGGNAYLG
jgi:tripartite-type tricarboxylate transporter receptor subunit TctC